MRLLLATILLFSAPSVMAFQARSCAEKVWMKKGLFRQYEVKYSSIEFISFKTSSEEGSMKVSSASSTQNSTMSLDPGITTGQTQSATQFSSTYGDCSIWASNDRWMRREFYIAENMGNIRSDVAKGDGEYLDTFLFLTGCPAEAKGQFSNLLHRQYSSLFNNEEYWGLGSDVDQLMQQDAVLRSTCNVFPTNA